ncbi:MAG: hypothetical protein ACPL5F_05385 [Moorellaceae bacterium]
MLKAVLDTNVLVSGLISPNGIPARLINAWREKKKYQGVKILRPAEFFAQLQNRELS